jgi:hypothetical protein
MARSAVMPPATFRLLGLEPMFIMLSSVIGVAVWKYLQFLLLYLHPGAGLRHKAAVHKSSCPDDKNIVRRRRDQLLQVTPLKPELRY